MTEESPSQPNNISRGDIKTESWGMLQMPRTSRKRARPKRTNSRYIAAGVAIVALAAAVGWFIYGANQGSTSSVTKTTTSQSGSTTNSSATSVYARIDTSMGSMEVQLFPSSAPKTVANFITLAKSGFYDNLVWHRIVAGFVIQTGDPNTRNGGGDRSLWGTGGSSQTVPLETDSSLHNDAGYLGMARAQDPNSGSSQFYINLANNSRLDNQYTVFGKVISGIDVAYSIGKISVNSAGQPVNPVFVTKITVLSQP